MPRVEYQLVEPKLYGEATQLGTADYLAAQARQETLLLCWVVAVQYVGNDSTEYGIAQKLQSLVVEHGVVAHGGFQALRPLFLALKVGHALVLQGQPVEPDVAGIEAQYALQH